MSGALAGFIRQDSVIIFDENHPPQVFVAYGRANLIKLQLNYGDETRTMFKTVKYLLLITLLFSVYAKHSVAEHSDSILNFKFNHLSNIQAVRSGEPSADVAHESALSFAQFDATWAYPWESKSMNIDVGVTLRHLSGTHNSLDGLGNNYFQKVFPLLHASALFVLPLEGLSAGIEGSHLDLSNHQVSDYRAKVSYEWRKGFGLQGGWQHQQFNLENATSNGAAGYEKNGPFLDFYLKF